MDVKEGAKLSVTHPYCNCDLAMLDPELTVKLPAKVKGIDSQKFIPLVRAALK